MSTSAADRTGGAASARAPRGVADALPALAAVVVFLVWAAMGGAALPRHLYAGGLFLLGLLAVSALAAGATRPPLPTAVALAALAGYAAWSYLSIAWAEVPADAWTGASRSAVYAGIFALFALRPWRPELVAVLLAAIACGVGAVGLLVLLELGGSSPLGDDFVAGRLQSPIGYPNAAAALFLLGLWPALFLASRREVPLPMRSVMLGLAGGLAALALLPQSRGAVVAFAASGALYLAVVPGRLRSLAAAAPVALVVGLGVPTLLRVFDEAGGPRFEQAVDDAVAVVVRSFLVLVAAGAVLAAVDRILPLPAVALPRRAGTAALLALATAAAVALAVVGDPVSRVEQGWEDFTSSPTADREGARLVGGLGGSRYDLWRVAAGAFVDHPLAGIGADNFSTAYLRERRTDDEPRYPHSLELQVLSQTGVVGGLLVATFLVSAFAAAWRAGRRAAPPGRAVVAVAGVVASAWLVQASFDWFWELPALTGPALALLAAAGRVQPAEVSAPTSRRWALGAGVVALAVAAALVPPWLAERYAARATSVWRADPALAFASLERAADLNPLTDRPALLEGAIAARLEEWDRMERAFRRALERNPSAWYAELELAVALSQQGRRDEALAHLRRAERLSPREPAIEIARERLRRGGRIEPAELDRIFLERVELRTG